MQLDKTNQLDTNQQKQNESIKVVVRFQSNGEIQKDDATIKNDGKSISIKKQQITRKSLPLSHRGSVREIKLNDQNIQQKTKVFHFDSVTETIDQKEFYANYAKDNVLDLQGSFIQKICLKGYNSTILVYGPAGTGKTFTILGDKQIQDKILSFQTYEDANDCIQLNQMYGIIPRSIHTIQQEMEEDTLKGVKYTIKCSYFEVYKEEITDLLRKPSNLRSVSQSLEIYECLKNGIIIKNILEEQVNTKADMLKCLQKGINNRKIFQSQDKFRASKSHTIYMLSLEKVMLDQTSTISHISFVDLAGSESAKLQNRLENQKINASLLTLAKCITSLSNSSDKKHVPFRESKLTRILKESFGGNSKTTLICTVKISCLHEQETIKTLRFARETMKIQNKISIKYQYTQEQLLEQIIQLKYQNSTLKRQNTKRNIKSYSEINLINRTKCQSELSKRRESISSFNSKSTQLTNKDAKSINNKKNYAQQLSQQSLKVIEDDDNDILDNQNPVLIEYKILYESLKKQSEQEIMKLNQQINSLHQQLKQTQDNKLQEIYTLIQQITSKHTDTFQEKQLQHQNTDDWQTNLSENNTSTINQNDVSISNTYDTRSQEQVKKSVDICQECLKNRVKISQYEKLFVQLNSQYAILSNDNQMNRDLILGFSKKLNRDSLLSLNNNKNNNGSLYSDDQDSCLNLNDDVSDSDESFDSVQERQFMQKLNKEIEEFQHQQDEFEEDIQEFDFKIDQYSYLGKRKNISIGSQQKSDRRSSYFASLSSFNCIDRNLKTEENNNQQGLFLNIHNDDMRENQRNKINSNQFTQNVTPKKNQYNQSKNNQGYQKSNYSYYAQNEKEKQDQILNYQNDQSFKSDSSVTDQQDSEDIELSRIDNSMYDDYEDEFVSKRNSISMTLKSENISDIIQENSQTKQKNNLNQNFKLRLSKKYLKDEEEQDNMNSYDSNQLTKRIQKNSSTLSQTNINYSNDSDDIQSYKSFQSETCITMKNKLKHQSHKSSPFIKQNLNKSDTKQMNRNRNSTVNTV